MAKKLLEVDLKLIDGQAKLKGSNADNKPESDVIVDFEAPFGTATGNNPGELLLMSLASCNSGVLLAVLRNRFKRTITDFKVNVKGVTRDKLPNSIGQIFMTFEITSPDVTEEELKTVQQSAEEKLCAVWDVLRGNTELNVDFKIIR